MKREPPRLVCVACGREHEWSLVGLCPNCGGLLDVEYDLAHAAIGDPGPAMIRFRDLLPLQSPDSATDYGEGNTRCLHARELGGEIGLDALWLKVEGDNPTGSVKDRQGPVMIAALRELGVDAFVTASTGNSCTSLARVLARHPDMQMHVFVGDEFLRRVDTCSAPNVKIYWLPGESFDAACRAADWFASDAGLPRDGGFFFFGKREGLKTAYLEAALQIESEVDVYLQGVSSGIGVYAAHRAARELRSLGLRCGQPRLVCVQEETCAPLAASFARGVDALHPGDVVDRPTGQATATLRGNPTGTYPHLASTVRASGGEIVSVRGEAVAQARDLVQRTEGLEVCAASALTIAAARDLVRAGRIGKAEVVLLNLTGVDRPPSPVRADFIVERRGESWELRPAQ